MKHTITLPPLVPIRWVPVDQSMAWLAAGWKDMWRTPAISLGFGAFFAAAGLMLWTTLSQTGMEWLILPLASGFLLIGPLAAAYLYEASRRMELNMPQGMADIWSSFRSRIKQVGHLGLLLLLLLLVWIQLAVILFAFYMGASPPPLDRFFGALFYQPGGLPLLLSGTLVGGILAIIAFSISAFSMPMLLERDVSVFEAVITSTRAVRLNWRNMIGWAATIATLTFLGMAFFFAGLVVTLPLIAHASWHAYRDVVGYPGRYSL